MGATKANDYTKKQLESATIGKATSHPARVRILEILNESFDDTQNVDLTRLLNFNKSTVKRHLDELLKAKLIRTDYVSHGYAIRLKEKGREVLNFYRKF